MEILTFYGKGRNPIIMNACDAASEYLYPVFNYNSLNETNSDQDFLIQLLYMQNKFDLKEDRKERDYIENQIMLGRYYTITEVLGKYTYGLLYENEKIDLNDMSHTVMEIFNNSKKKLIDLFINRNHAAGYIHLGKYYQAKEFIDIIDFYYNLKKGDKKKCQS